MKTLAQIKKELKENLVFKTIKYTNLKDQKVALRNNEDKLVKGISTNVVLSPVDVTMVKQEKINAVRDEIETVLLCKLGAKKHSSSEYSIETKKGDVIISVELFKTRHDLNYDSGYKSVWFLVDTRLEVK